jgi:hypothetical protein
VCAGTPVQYEHTVWGPAFLVFALELLHEEIHHALVEVLPRHRAYTCQNKLVLARLVVKLS